MLRAARVMTRRQAFVGRSRSEAKVYLLVSPLYLLALVVLLLNDYTLKRYWPGFVSGKLSDFAGLFALAVFLLVITRSRFTLVALALCFAFWKSPLASGVIQVWNSATGFAIGRTVDLTDLIALAVLPFASLFFRTAEPEKLCRSWCCTLSYVVSLFAFTATSRAPTPQQEAAFHAAVAEFAFPSDGPSYSFSLDRSGLYRALESWGFRVSGNTAIFPNPGKHSAYLIPPRSRSLRDRSATPELFGAQFDVDDSGRGVTIRVTKLSITRAGHSISRTAAIRLFESSVVSPLRRTGAFVTPPRELCVATESNRAMHRTASKAATDVQRVCHPCFSCVARFTRLAVADLASR
jgi:hypothetical protein